jgi:hypothetical protein
MTADRAPDRLPGPLEWLLRDRVSGGITIAQFPNPALWTWLAATVLGLWWRPTVGDVDVLVVLSTGALLVWAVDEVLRGVNPFRRLLGAAVLVAVVGGLLRD